MPTLRARGDMCSAGRWIKWPGGMGGCVFIARVCKLEAEKKQRDEKRYIRWCMRQCGAKHVLGRWMVDCQPEVGHLQNIRRIFLQTRIANLGILALCEGGIGLRRDIIAVPRSSYWLTAARGCGHVLTARVDLSSGLARG